MAASKHPLFTLREMEERARALLHPPAAASPQRWVGLLVRISEQTLLIATSEIREVFSVRRHPKPSPVPGSKVWLKGLASLRGELLSIIDLGEYLHRTPCQTGSGARVIVTKHPNVRAGLLVDEIIGLRQFVGSQRTTAPPNIAWTHTAYTSTEGIFPVLSIDALGLNPEFCNAANG